jgi:hypothetical protein
LLAFVATDVIVCNCTSLIGWRETDGFVCDIHVEIFVFNVTADFI